MYNMDDDVGYFQAHDVDSQRSGAVAGRQEDVSRSSERLVSDLSLRMGPAQTAWHFINKNN